MIRDTDIEDELAPEIGRQPRREAFEDDETFRDAVREYMDALKETDQYREWFDHAIEPTLNIAREVGNWYTGSVHVARASALKNAAERGEELTGEKLFVGSYGSGAQAEIHAETIQDEWREEIEALDIDARLDERYDLSFAEYEEIHDVHNHDKAVEVEELTTPSGEFVYDGRGRMNERKYRYVD